MMGPDLRLGHAGRRRLVRREQAADIARRIGALCRELFDSSHSDAGLYVALARLQPLRDCLPPRTHADAPR